jgi:hypothetical protein
MMASGGMGSVLAARARDATGNEYVAHATRIDSVFVLGLRRFLKEAFYPQMTQMSTDQAIGNILICRICVICGFPFLVAGDSPR